MFGLNVELNGKVPLKNWRKIAMGTWDSSVTAEMKGKMDVDVSNVLKFIENKSKELGVKITPTHFMVKVLAHVLEEFPEANSIIRWKRLYYRKNIDIFTHVAMGEGGSDLSGIRILKVNQKTLQNVAEEFAIKTKKIRANNDDHLGKTKQIMAWVPWFCVGYALKLISFFQYTLNLSPRIFGLPKDAFGSAMLTSLGMNDLEYGFGPLVPWSRVPIVVMLGRIQDKPIVKNGEIVIAPIVSLGVTIDHRHVDGFIATKMAELIKTIFENPEKYIR